MLPLGAITFEDTVEYAATGLDAVGVAAIVVGIGVATFSFMTARGTAGSYGRYRHGIGRAILLGLEFLVAADIIRTVAIAPTFRGVGVLALIVLIRTFLSFTIEVELEGRWPWQRDDPREPVSDR